MVKSTVRSFREGTGMRKGERIGRWEWIEVKKLSTSTQTPFWRSYKKCRKKVHLLFFHSFYSIVHGIQSLETRFDSSNSKVRSTFSLFSPPLQIDPISSTQNFIHLLNLPNLKPGPKATAHVTATTDCMC